MWLGRELGTAVLEGEEAGRYLIDVIAEHGPAVTVKE